MLYSLKVFSQDRWIRSFFLVAALAQSALWVFTIYNIRFLNKEITFILHTNVVVGANLYGQWWSVYYFPLAGLALLIINFFVALWFFNKDSILARCLAVATVTFEVFLLVLTYTIIRINT